MKAQTTNKIKIAILGAGTVGSSVINHYFNKKPGWQETELIKIVVKDLLKKRVVKIPPSIISTDLNKTLIDSSVQIVVSLLGDETIEYKSIKQALKNKKFVVTANKVVIAKHGLELFKIAKQNNVRLFFEASVGGGIQVIDNLLERYTSNSFNSVLGILNGTTNYILTKMSENKIKFEEALEDAKLRGYAEPDPTNDIEGFDSAYKLSILASLTFRKGWVNPKNIHIEGITKISESDFRYAKHLGYVIKLIGFASNINHKISAWVAPVMLLKGHLLSDVNGVQNAILLKGDSIGETKLQGLGAGGLPTSASVWSDILKACNYINNNIFYQNINLSKEASVLPFSKYQHRNYLRLIAIDKPGVIGKIGEILGKNNVSINQIIQLDSTKSEINGKKCAEIAIDMDSSKEENVIKAVQQLSKNPVCKKIGARLRIIN